ncbi:MAG: SDR family oxidoreductase [Treponemataceae bacterium]
MDVKGKSVLISGGGTGIGRSCALRLAALGAKIAVNYSRSAEEAAATVAEILASGGKAVAIQADIAKDAEARAMAERVIAEFGRIDVLINNAGRTHYIEMADLDGVKEEQWDEIFNTNVKGTFLVTRACASALKEAGGCVVNVASIAGIRGTGSSLPYAVSKGAIITLTKGLARSLAPRVRVNAVAPGIVNTRWVAGKSDHIARLSEGTLLGRVAEADDVAEAILGLILHGDFITGQTIVVDGGYCL